MSALGKQLLFLILSLFLVHNDTLIWPGHRILWTCPLLSFVLHSRHRLLLCIYTIPIIMGLVNVGDPKYCSSTNTESHHIHKFTLPRCLSFICLVSEGCFKCGRSICENIAVLRRPVKGKNVLLLGQILFLLK